jgi:DNA mismatch endonuclease, patch repair protein
MASQPREGTGPELQLRRELHRRGLRYRLHRRIVPGHPRRTVDIVFGPARVAVFVDGCFWHGCPDHGNLPTNNADWWRDKLATNVQRDRETDRALKAAGWRVVRVWEHADVIEQAARIEASVRTGRG